MKIINKGEDTFEVMGDSGVAYIVTFKSCTCPHYKTRMAKVNGRCKHMIFLLNELTKGDDKNLKLLEYIRKNGQVKFQDLQSQFTDINDNLNMLEKQGEIMYNRWNDTYQLLE